MKQIRASRHIIPALPETSEVKSLLAPQRTRLANLVSVALQLLQVPKIQVPASAERPAVRAARPLVKALSVRQVTLLSNSRIPAA
jgi:hypothetical protein